MHVGNINNCPGPGYHQFVAPTQKAGEIFSSTQRTLDYRIVQAAFVRSTEPSEMALTTEYHPPSLI